jgi:hypothetical protein
LCAEVNGFSIHAERTVPSHDRKGLERLLNRHLPPLFMKPVYSKSLITRERRK